VDPNQYYCIDYRDLTKSPLAALEKLYAHFGWTMSRSFRDKLTAATQRQREFKSKHEYTLEEFGLSKEWIQAGSVTCWTTMRCRGNEIYRLKIA